MTPTTEIAARVEPSSDAQVIGLVSAAHFVSHYYILVLPPLFTVIRADFGVSYTELGLALTAFNVVSALLQTPAGFLADRVSARAVLIGGLLLGAAALAGAAVLPSFWAFVTMFALLGLGNTVYHPADYALLSRHVSPRRMGQAYSVHTFAGMLGGAVAPASLLFLAAAFGWRGAYLASAALGTAVAATLLLMGRALADDRAERGTAGSAPAAANPEASPVLLLSAPVLLNLLFFVMLALSNAGVQNYAVVVLDALYATPLNLANVALTAYLATSAFGVLIGGVVATRTTRHSVVAIAGLAGAACAAGGARSFADRGDDRAVRARRPGDRHHHAVARPPGACRHASGRLRQGVRLRYHRLQHRRHGVAAAVRLVPRYRQPARRVPGDGGVHPGRHPDRNGRRRVPACAQAQRFVNVGSASRRSVIGAQSTGE
jgi:MFS transporter, FSR family, fosmidomycin resistance protein